MNAVSVVPTTPVRARMPLGVYALEAKFEFLRVLRTPAFAVPTLLFPPMFYLLFGLILNRGNAGAAQYLFATYCVFGVMAPGLFGFGVGVAIERERGWLDLKRVAPMPPGAYLGAKMIMAMLFALIIFCTLAIMAATLGGLRMEAGKWLLLALISMLGVMPFCALGLVIGSRVTASAAPAIVNFIYLPMAFLSGLWLPIKALPAVLGQLAPLWPSYHLAQLALSAIGSGGGDGSATLPHIAVLIVFTALCLAIARRAMARKG